MPPVLRRIGSNADHSRHRGRRVGRSRRRAGARASRSPTTIRTTRGRCSSPSAARGCHSLEAAGAQGSANRALRNQGPNLNERIESADDVLYAIRNGGFSGAIMPQNILVGDEADAVAHFVGKYSGAEVDRPPKPGGAARSSPSSSRPPPRR